MDLLPDESQETLGASARDYLRTHYALEATPSPQPSTTAWSELADLGWLGLLVDEQAGGSGATLADTAIVFGALGEALMPGPILGTVLAAAVAARGGDTELAAALIGGERRAGLAIPLPRSSAHLAADTVDADLVLVFEPTRAELRRFERRRTVACVDESTDLAEITLTGEPVACVERAVFDAFSHALVLTSALSVGIADATTAMSTEYAQVREQFGRKIGTFQAVSHRCADMATRAETATMQTRFAALSLDTDTPDAADQAAMAALLATEAARLNAADNVQNHGAIGFTVELPAHRFVTRAHVLSRMPASETDLLDLVLPRGATLAGHVA